MPTFSASDGVRIHFEDEGTGPALVFLHGWMMSGRFFQRQLDALPGMGRRTIAMDLRGCGASEARPGTHTMDRFAQDAHELVQHLRLENVVLVGWSMGGGITMRYLDRYGESGLRGVALIDFPPRFEEDPAVPAKVCARLHHDRAKFFDGFFRRMFANSPAADDLAWMVVENQKCSADTGCEMYRQMGAGDARGRFYDVPALLCFPSQGWFPQAADEWRKVFPRHEAPAFDRSRHCPFWEEPDAFNKALVDFAPA